jgi:hypothetical protein
MASVEYYTDPACPWSWALDPSVRKLDHAEALIQEARTAGLDVERFRLALRSHAITEAFGDDLERAKRLGEEAGFVGRASVEEAIARFGRVTTAEVEALCELPGPRARAELYRLAEAWRVRPVKTLTGFLWRRRRRAALQPEPNPSLRPTSPTPGRRTVPASLVASPMRFASG